MPHPPPFSQAPLGAARAFTTQQPVQPWRPPQPRLAPASTMERATTQAAGSVTRTSSSCSQTDPHACGQPDPHACGQPDLHEQMPHHVREQVAEQTSSQANASAAHPRMIGQFESSGCLGGVSPQGTIGQLRQQVRERVRHQLQQQMEQQIESEVQEQMQMLEEHQGLHPQLDSRQMQVIAQAMEQLQHPKLHPQPQLAQPLSMPPQMQMASMSQMQMQMPVPATPIQAQPMCMAHNEMPVTAPSLPLATAVQCATAAATQMQAQPMYMAQNEMPVTAPSLPLATAVQCTVPMGQQSMQLPLAVAQACPVEPQTPPSWSMPGPWPPHSEPRDGTLAKPLQREP